MHSKIFKPHCGQRSEEMKRISRQVEEAGLPKRVIDQEGGFHERPAKQPGGEASWHNAITSSPRCFPTEDGTGLAAGVRETEEAKGYG